MMAINRKTPTRIKRVFFSLHHSSILKKTKWPIFILFVLIFQKVIPSQLTVPVSEILLQKKAYTIAYDGRSKQARWVYEALTKDSTQGMPSRKEFGFFEDIMIPQLLRAKNEDYRCTGFDRGHLCPAADALSDDLMRETFCLSNITPQCPQLNRGYWAKLEKHVRGLIKVYKEIDVYTGPLFLPIRESDGRYYVKYQVIGENNVAVPTHFFKVIFSKRKELIEAFIVPNEPIEAGTSLYKFSATLEKVERAAGIIFP